MAPVLHVRDAVPAEAGAAVDTISPTETITARSAEPPFVPLRITVSPQSSSSNIEQWCLT